VNQLKVYEFAKQIGVETLVLMDKIREWQLPIKSHMATLDETMMSDIEQRLKAARSSIEGSSKTKKKTVKKKTEAPAGTTAASGVAAKSAAKATTKKTTKSAPPKIIAPKTAATKTAKVKTPDPAELTAASAAAAVAAAAARPVIRRKAGEAEQRAIEAAEENMRALQAIEASQEAYQPHQAESAVPTSDGDEQVPHLTSATETASTVAEGAPVAPSEAFVRPRKNIVGRMDLRRVATIQPSREPGQGGPSAPGSAPSPIGPPGAPGVARVSRSAPRNIRTGFFSAEPTFVAPTDDVFKDKQKDEKTKKRGAGAGREGEQKVFTATEFRKREVIFQPKKKKAMTARDARKTQLTTPAAHKRVVKIHGSIKLSELANEMGLKAPALLKKLMQQGVQASMNATLDFDTVALIVTEFGWEAQNVQFSSDELITEAAFGDLEATPVERPPVVTVMGHVDHGKTTLLDSIRKARVAAGEAGGITQHIGAYSVTLDSGHVITFIDTPGHEAFTAMRARGANVTDIAIIVVAADDGLMPQTAEAINHAKAAGVPIIIAVNKMDKPGANPDRIKQQLTEFELVPEEWGGTTIFCPVSALKGDGIKELLEQIVLVAEVAELKANPKRSATGTVIEARMEKGRGSVASVLVRDGTLEVGQVIACGTVVGRVRSMSDDKGKPVKSVGPGFPVEILGLPMPPQAGDRFDVCKDEEMATRLAASRVINKAVEETPANKMTLEQLFSKVKSGDVKELALILKTDVAGSLEAVRGVIEKLGSEEVKVKVVHAAVGGITESDVLLATTAHGLVVGFNVRPDTGAARLAKEKGVEIKSYSIIYELADDLKKALSGMLTPDIVEKIQGRAEVRNTFVVPKLGMIAGCAVVDGKITRNNQARLIRDGKIVFDSKIVSLKRFKDDAKEVATGFECGIGIENFNDIKVGDIIEAYTKEEVSREL
jgi:translation initiation factor IF-2